MRRVDVILGTRPEAIKMAPVYKAIRATPGIDVRLTVTGQHRELLHQALEAFHLRPDIDLGVMREKQTLTGLTAQILLGLEKTFAGSRPDLVLTHGDTTTCYAAALSCFYHSIPFFHVESGLRTYRLDSPFPEEFNRQSVARLASHHFAPTDREKSNLMSEGISPSEISVTGSTVRDAMREVQSDTAASQEGSGKLAVITLHRREKDSRTLTEVLEALKRAAIDRSDVRFVFPVHPSPVVRAEAERVFQGVGNVQLVSPLDYSKFLALLFRASVIVTDSGGVQEEAAALGKKVLLVREATERTDGLSTGQTEVVGTNGMRIYRRILESLSGAASQVVPELMFSHSPSQRIAAVVASRCGR